MEQDQAESKEAVEKIAKELLALYATRRSRARLRLLPRHRLAAGTGSLLPLRRNPRPADRPEQVKDDMENKKPMDRLVCGDVGYGKTEIAIRAAFKAVMDGKQVAVLVPTTVLAEQHYVTFSQRLEAFPVRVEVLSRFRSPQTAAADPRRPGGRYRRYLYRHPPPHTERCRF